MAFPVKKYSKNFLPREIVGSGKRGRTASSVAYGDDSLSSRANKQETCAQEYPLISLGHTQCKFCAGV